MASSLPQAASTVSSTQVAAMVFNYLRSNGFFKVTSPPRFVLHFIFVFLSDINQPEGEKKARARIA